MCKIDTIVLFFTLSMVLMGCDARPVPPFGLVFEEGVDAEKAALVVEGSKEWNARIGAEMFYTTLPSEKGDCDHIYIHFLDHAPDRKGIAVGLKRRVGCNFVVKLAPGGVTRPTILHELGHTLKLGEEEDDIESVMFWMASPWATEILEEDVALIREIWGIKPRA